MKHSLRAFRHSNFRLFFAGQSISVIGTWVHAVAMSWLVYRLSGSALMLGLTAFASMAPIFFFAPLGGLLADRVNRQKLLTFTQVLAAVHAVAMAALAYADLLGPWHVIALATLIGIIAACETPIRQSFLPEMVPVREDLPSAVAFNAFMQQAGRLIGPTIAGLLLAAWSEALCFLVNGASKLAVIAAIAAMAVDEKPRTRRRPRLRSELADGLRYAWDTVPVRILLPTLALVSFLVAPYQSLMPIFAAEIYHGGADTLGYLMGAAGLGGATVVLVLASRKDVRGLARIILVAAITAGLALVAFALTRWLWLALLLMPLVGAGMLAVITGTSTVLQIIVEDEQRGRVMSLYTMSFLGMVPMGSLAAGVVADHIGAPLTLALSGGCCVAAGIAYWTQLPLLRAHMRAHYVRLGIMRE
ncbi:MAG: MFS transporter [Burkholderiales bacterium]|nr:MFS transporter [Burkholderiales bacterium]